MSPGADVIVVGGGIVGAACAYALAGAGARVRVCERAFVASGSSGACEGNVLAWDKGGQRAGRGQGGRARAAAGAALGRAVAAARARAARRLRVRPQGQRGGGRDG